MRLFLVYCTYLRFLKQVCLTLDCDRFIDNVAPLCFGLIFKYIFGISKKILLWSIDLILPNWSEAKELLVIKQRIRKQQLTLKATAGQEETVTLACSCSDLEKPPKLACYFILVSQVNVDTFYTKIL